MLDCFGKKNLQEGVSIGKACSMIDGDGERGLNITKNGGVLDMYF